MIGLGGSLRRFADTPEVNVAMFGFLLNYPWEFLQVPFFQGMAEAPHWQAVKSCSRAALGDAAILVVAFWGIAAMAGSRLWVLRPRLGQILGFIGIGLTITLLVEHLAIGALDLWDYAEPMPVVPILGIGLAPLLQWVLLPPLAAWLVRRQLT